jgi:pimeloyl-ACP methyl ester carboxylesterase
MRSGTADVGGARLYYETAGKGDPIVLLHAGGIDRRMWDDQFEAFAAHRTVVRYDARGSGNSDLPEGPFALHEDLFALMRSLSIERADLVGCSLGGKTAIDFAIEHPEMVRALVLVGSGLSGHEFSEAYRQRLAPLASAILNRDVSAFVRAYLDDDTLAPSEEYTAARLSVAEMLEESFAGVGAATSLWRPPEPPAAERLVEIAAPALVVVGERDADEIHAIAKLLVAGIRGAKHVVIPGGHHLVNMEWPEEFNRIVSEFLHLGLAARP